MGIKKVKIEKERQGTEKRKKGRIGERVIKG